MGDFHSLCLRIFIKILCLCLSAKYCLLILLLQGKYMTVINLTKLEKKQPCYTLKLYNNILNSKKLDTISNCVTESFIIE